MTISEHGKDKTRSTWGKEVQTVDSEDNAHSLRSYSTDERSDGNDQRCGSPGANIERTSATSISITVNGKLARQLRKTLMSQLAEHEERKQKIKDRLVTYDQKIEDLRNDLENIEQIIQELEEAEEESTIEGA
ncbi:hypothetical protein [Floridanema evergladense]|uniref:Uncharacterized protein n=1 Tax=Floridaenema evergladense BLCC-F167 TaxID=3153639 RepID=A0ABV4WF32_9CYAN